MVFSTRCAKLRTPQALRAATDLSTTVLFLPLLNGLCRVYTCMPGSPWLTTSWSCFEGPHLAVTVAVSVLLALFSAACALGAYVDSILHACMKAMRTMNSSLRANWVVWALQRWPSSSIATRCPRLLPARHMAASTPACAA